MSSNNKSALYNKLLQVFNASSKSNSYLHNNTIYYLTDKEDLIKIYNLPNHGLLKLCEIVKLNVPWKSIYCNDDEIDILIDFIHNYVLENVKLKRDICIKLYRKLERSNLEHIRSFTMDDGEKETVMNKFNRFVVHVNGLIYGIFSDNDDTLDVSDKYRNTMDLVPERQWDDEYGAYDSEFISSTNVPYEDIDKIFEDIDELRRYVASLNNNVSEVEFTPTVYSEVFTGLKGLINRKLSYTNGGTKCIGVIVDTFINKFGLHFVVILSNGRITSVSSDIKVCVVLPECSDVKLTDALGKTDD